MLRCVLSVFCIVSFTFYSPVCCHGASRSSSPNWSVVTSLLRLERQSQVSVKGNSYDAFCKLDFAWSERVKIIFFIEVWCVIGVVEKEVVIVIHCCTVD